MSRAYLRYMTVYPCLIDNPASLYREHFIAVHYLIFDNDIKKCFFLGLLFLKENFNGGQD